MVVFIAEIGSNWEGDLKKAKELVRKCKKAGANYVKFQMWRAEDLYDNDDYKKYELDFYQATKIKEFCDLIGIEFFCSVFYPEAVELLERLDVKLYKIGSRTFTQADPYSQETLEAVARTKKPVIFSDGFFKVKLKPKSSRELFCIPEYPADPLLIDWDKIGHYDGFSDHTPGIETALLYCKKYPDKILEKHVKLTDSKGPDAFFSITTQELADLIIKSKS